MLPPITQYAIWSWLGYSPPNIQFKHLNSWPTNGQLTTPTDCSPDQPTRMTWFIATVQQPEKFDCGLTLISTCIIKPSPAELEPSPVWYELHF